MRILHKTSNFTFFMLVKGVSGQCKLSTWSTPQSVRKDLLSSSDQKQSAQCLPKSCCDHK